MIKENESILNQWIGTTGKQRMVSAVSMGVFTGGGTSAVIHAAEGNIPAAIVDTVVTFSPLVVTKDGRNAISQVMKAFTPRLNKNPKG